MAKVLVIGENSFIGKHLKKYDRISFRDIDSIDFGKYDVVINCALNPLYKTNKYHNINDIDLKVGQYACPNNCHFVMLSTSKVYGSDNYLRIYDEFSAPKPDDHYGTNKLITENILLSNYPENVTILRGSNIFGFEYGRNSFTGYCMSQIVNEGVVNLTITGNLKRDFLFVEDAVKLIELVCEVKPKGVYNLSSGVGLPIIDFIHWLIAGYRYDIEVLRTTKDDRQFILDNSKLQKALNVKIGPFDYEKILYNLGKQLCKI